MPFRQSLKVTRHLWQAENTTLEVSLRAADFVAQSSPLNATRWLKGLQSAIESLTSMPNRWGAALQNDFLDEELRQYIYKSHRIIFQVDETTGLVRILHIRHATRRTLCQPDED